MKIRYRPSRGDGIDWPKCFAEIRGIKDGIARVVGKNSRGQTCKTDRPSVSPQLRQNEKRYSTGDLRQKFHMHEILLVLDKPFGFRTIQAPVTKWRSVQTQKKKITERKTSIFFIYSKTQVQTKQATKQRNKQTTSQEKEESSYAPHHTTH